MFGLRLIVRTPVITAVACVAGIVSGAVVKPTHAVPQAADSMAVRSPNVTTSAEMRGIFTALTTAYAYSLDADFFEDRHNRETVLAALRALVSNTEALETHGAGLDPSFDYLRHSLAADAYEALDRYQNRQFAGSRFMLNKLVENCATCHVRLPAGQPFDTGAKFLEKADVGALPPVDRVNIEVATRQFDRAIATYEEIFQLPDMTAPGLMLIGAFESYLELCIGVKGDTRRPIRALTAYQKRGDITPDTKAEVDAWIAALKRIDLAAAAGQELKAARELIGSAEPVRRAPQNRQHLVEYVAAASLLHRYMRATPAHDANLSEAYYLLAVAESHISRSQWISETRFLLEHSISAGPDTQFAQEAKRILKDWPGP